MEDLKSRLMEQAREKGICADGYSEMRAGDMDSLVDYYIQNPDWCLERNFPDMRTLSEKFSDIGDRGVFVKKTFHGELMNDRQVYIFHKCRGTIKVGLNFEKSLIPMIYVANGCKLRIIGVGGFAPKRKEDRSAVPVYSFGKNCLSAKDNKFVRFIRFESNIL